MPFTDFGFPMYILKVECNLERSYFWPMDANAINVDDGWAYDPNDDVCLECYSATPVSSLRITFDTLAKDVSYTIEPLSKEDEPHEPFYALEHFCMTLQNLSDDVIIRFEEISKKGETEMNPNTTNQTIVDRVEIPDDLAKELSELLIKQTIRERVLVQLINKPEEYNAAESMLIPIVARIEAIKAKITASYIPAQWNHDRYIWNYNGYEIDRNQITIVDTSFPV